jgi:hypothetical protein
LEEQQRGILIFDNASYEKDVRLLMESFHRRATSIIQLFNVIERPFFGEAAKSRRAFLLLLPLGEGISGQTPNGKAVFDANPRLLAPASSLT